MVGHEFRFFSFEFPCHLLQVLWKERMLEPADHYHATGEALEECARLVRGLEIQRYWGDYAL